MRPLIGIRREDKNAFERRVPLTPGHVRQLVADAGIDVIVQPSPLRAFPESDYLAAGARIAESLDPCGVVFGVKEMPSTLFRTGGAYVFFSHTIKGQAYNMPMLARLLETGASLIDYERITDPQNRRLVFFGRHAGLAGMIDTLWALGVRCRSEGLRNPFEAIRPAHGYATLADAEAALRDVADHIRRDGVPEPLRPLVVGFAGYGNVSLGAQAVFDLLPHTLVQPEALTTLSAATPEAAHTLFKVVFREEHTVAPRDPAAAFELQHYFRHPDAYRGIFQAHLPHLTVLVNAIYWSPQAPRLVTFEDVHALYGGGRSPRLKVIGDISCDVEGGVQCTVQCTDSGDPVFVYDVDARAARLGFDGHGPVVLAVDNLPCELPRDASASFGDALMPFVPAIARADFQRALAELDLPPEIRRALIVHRGTLTPDYQDLQRHLQRRNG